MSAASRILAAPAKVNFGLRVLGRRDDGYHLLESLFLPLELADEIALEARSEPGVALSVEGAPGLPEDARNLAHRAASAFLEAAGVPGGVDVRLRKRIPSPAGLGGGSSDAGAVLRGLADLWPARISPGRLAALAATLGADVPFFLDPRPALVGGIGERLEPVAGVPAFALALAHPGTALATPTVYAAYDEAPGTSLTGPGAGPTIRALLALRETDGAPRAGCFEGGPDGPPWRLLLANDLEAPATRLCPAVAELREEFEATEALAVGMSGSGPTVYGVFADAAQAGRAAARLEATGARTWVAHTLPSV